MVGTHGQLKNLYSKRILKFQAVRIVVFDEADEMLKVGLPLALSLQCAGIADFTIYSGKDALALFCQPAILLCCVLHSSPSFHAVWELLTSIAPLMQLDGFGSDSVRLVRDLRRDAQQPVQFLLFSATFNERIKNYALRVTTDEGREEVNQVQRPAIIGCSCKAISAVGIPVRIL
jgi:hypothetical protein